MAGAGTALERQQSLDLRIIGGNKSRETSPMCEPARWWAPPGGCSSRSSGIKCMYRNEGAAGGAASHPSILVSSPCTSWVASPSSRFSISAASAARCESATAAAQTASRHGDVAEPPLFLASALAKRAQASECKAAQPPQWICWMALGHVDRRYSTQGGPRHGERSRLRPPCSPARSDLSLT